MFKVVSPICHTDPLAVKGLSSGFGITVDKPGDQQTGLTFPVEVKGEICSGRPINAFHLQGKLYPIDPSALTHVAGNGTTTADTYKFDFDVNVGQTDVSQDIRLGTAPAGTFDPGTNRLIMSAADDAGN